MLITQEAAKKRFEGQDAITCMPTDLKRLIIPAFGFTGAVKTQRPDYLPPDYKQVMVDTEGLEFHNPKDDAKQVLKQQDGCLICYEKPGMKEKVDAYIAKHPDAFKTAENVQKFLKFLMPLTANPKTGKADVWDTDVAFAAGLVNAPEKGKIVPGHTFAGTKKKECVKAFYIPYGDEFQGPTGDPQKPTDKRGAFIVLTTNKKGETEMHLIQFDEFFKAYDTGDKAIRMKQERKNVEGPRHYYTDYETETIVADKHVLKFTLADGDLSSISFDAEPISIVSKLQNAKEKWGPRIPDWPASYQKALQEKNPELADFIQRFMFSPEEQKRFQKEQFDRVFGNAIKVKNRGRGMLAVMKGLRAAGLLETATTKHRSPRGSRDPR